jgi:hypothetical protein
VSKHKSKLLAALDDYVDSRIRRALREQEQPPLPPRREIAVLAFDGRDFWEWVHAAAHSSVISWVNGSRFRCGFDDGRTYTYIGDAQAARGCEFDEIIATAKFHIRPDAHDIDRAIQPRLRGRANYND